MHKFHIYDKVFARIGDTHVFFVAKILAFNDDFSEVQIKSIKTGSLFRYKVEDLHPYTLWNRSKDFFGWLV